MKGITGSSRLAISEVAVKLAEIRKQTNLPVGVGFGIKDATTAQSVAQVGDAVIVGSALVSRVEALAQSPEQIAPSVVELLLKFGAKKEIQDFNGQTALDFAQSLEIAGILRN